MLPRFWNRSITVVRGVVVPGRGDDTYIDYSNPVTHVEKNCYYGSPSTTEDIVLRDGSKIDYVLRGALLDLKKTDRVRLYTGEYDPSKPEFEIVGAVLHIPSATGRMDHNKAFLSVWEG